MSWYAERRGFASRIKAGEYVLESGTTPRTMLDQLIAGRVRLHSLTIVEGWRFADMLSVMRRHPAIVSSGLGREEIMVRLGASGEHPEGRFLPDTYRFPRGIGELVLLKQAYDAMRDHLAESWAQRAPGVSLSSAYQALILASIVEKETALETERGRIAGVFLRRLDLKMRLQTDPTVIYGLGEAFDGNLRRRDLETDTPYNTYTRGGLPPTPIALPGLASIRAVVNPNPGNELYFVATGQADGSHYFSANLSDHNAAVRRYLQRLRASKN